MVIMSLPPKKNIEIEFFKITGIVQNNKIFAHMVLGSHFSPTHTASSVGKNVKGLHVNWHCTHSVGVRFEMRIHLRKKCSLSLFKISKFI